MDAFKTLSDNIQQGLIREANLLSIELLSSGCHVQLWDILISVYFKYVNCHDPRMVNYVNQKYLLYCEVKKTYTGNLKNLCNNQELRNHLAEMITVLCLSQKDEIIVPTELIECRVDDVILDKSMKFVNIFARNISKNSLLYQNLSGFIVNYFNNSIKNCVFYLDWFVKDIEYTVETELDFKIPVILAKKSVLLIFKFLVLQIKAQIKIINKTSNIDEITEILDTVISFYIMLYKKKDYDTCTYIGIYMLLFSRCIEGFDNLHSVDTTNPVVIKQCAEINLLYRQLHQTIVMEQTKTQTTTKKTGKKTKINTQFYEDPTTQEYLKLIYDCDLVRKNEQIKDIHINASDKQPSCTILRKNALENTNDENTDHEDDHTDDDSDDSDVSDGDDADTYCDDGTSDGDDTSVDDEGQLTISTAKSEKNQLATNVNINVELCE
jgi:hypothetical protein